MDGLGITFDAYGSIQQRVRGYHQPHHPVHAPAVAAHAAAHHHRLQHSVSYDAALNGHYAAQPMYRHPSDTSGDSAHKRVRIAAGTPEVLNGKGGYLPYDQHHLSPLSDFAQSSNSGTGSSQPFSPVSLSSLPSSTDAGAYPSFPSHALPHDAYPIRNHPHATSHADLHHAQQPSPSRGPSRLPAFLQDRQQALARPRSMVELRQSQQARERTSPPSSMHAPYAEHVEHAQYDASPSDRYDHLQDSPAESVPSSAGALQRRQFERQLQSDFDERRRLRASEGRPRERTQSEGVIRPLERVRSRSLSAKEMKELADREASRRVEEQVPLPQEPGAARLETVDDEALEAEEGDDDVGTVISLAPPPQREPGASGLQRQSTLLTAGASTVRRRKELDRLLAPTSRHAGISSLGTIAQSPTPSTTSSAVTNSTQPRAASHASAQVASLPSPVVLEQAKHGKGARVELDLALETPLVVEGGLLKGRLEVRIRKSKEREGEVWVGTPKIRVIGFEELSSGDGRYIFYHASAPASTSTDPLACYDSPADSEGFHRGKSGQHNVAVKMSLPIGKGAKGPWKGKQGVVRYIAIASLKLKSKEGSDRSIAHFYRHVEVYPYFNPALTLAPAIKPLTADAAKSLFMGGSGKVTLHASLHRETWVAGQRCYVEVRVSNESSKKVKALTLALIRTTAVYRSASRTTSHGPRDLYGFGVDAVPASSSEPTQTQTTRKKVAETTLELGKKGTKGVTAKGTWLGVEAGESADFAPSFLIPEDALTIARGRHLENTYSVKVSVGGSLSADISVDIPIRVVNFISLDPPPGHVGPSPLPDQPRRPVARSWSSNQLRDAVRPSQATVGRMTSHDSLRLEDLNGARPRQQRPPLSRIASVESVRTSDLPRAEPVADRARPAPAQHLSARSDEENLPPAERSQVVVDRAKRRQLQHQMSLQCISSAIASATARRSPNVREREPTLRAAASHGDLYEARLAVDESPDAGYYGGGVEEDLFTLPAVNLHSDVQFGLGLGLDDVGIQLDDLDEVPDDPTALDRHVHHEPSSRYQPQEQHQQPCRHHYQPEPMRPEDLYASQPADAHVDADQDSDDELDSILQSHFSEDEDEHLDRPTSLHARAPSSPPQRAEPAVPRSASPVKRHSPIPPSSPVKASPSSRRPSDTFAFATPSSPIKAGVELPVVDEDEHPAARTTRPLPTPPVVHAAPSSPRKASHVQPAAGREPSSLRKTPSGASLRRNPGVLRKAGSTRSIRSAASSLYVASTADATRALGMARSPSIASPRVSPILASGTTFGVRPTLSPTVATPASPVRRVVKTPSPSLRPTRSMAELRSAPPPSSFFAGGSPHERPASPRKSTVLPSVKNKVAALETRQATLHRLATTSREGGRARVPAAQLSRADSIMSSASSVMPSEFNLNRTNSMASFKAPLLKRGATILEPTPPVPSLPAL
ncbi:uncharacterized protein RHOBADRAFT_43430 [Rhodotorula graminis WP1]|uniref:Arrestin C-terminal-like domain-containing protein n=1 Tax=Rhodotorula graminis (strain WP1) TaxID=578459 RepID=A0A194S675_RHOGW|nr:uncharacterized protein RHOBADRAFT_43430 [Rhodotorula graminis WP1]KPV75995.1 hypothetical protein RHOBADRAFT_43430 [Rhodotorula graminis WP1]